MSTDHSTLTYRRREDNSGSINQQSNKQASEDQIPKPNEYVCFLIDDVQWKYTKRIVLLYRSWSSVLVEDALSNAREDIDHRIDTLLLWCVWQIEHTQSIGEKLAIEEAIHQVKLRQDVDQADGLAGEVPIDVCVVLLQDKEREG